MSKIANKQMICEVLMDAAKTDTVSYTHLTLPTKA